MRNEPRSLRSAPHHGPDTGLRDEGFAFVGRANRWMISGAVVLAAAVSALTAHAFHAHAATSTTRAQQASSTQASGENGSTTPLQPPSQSPSAAPSAPAPVVSGGS